jgi:CPA2 family monovalent cation:H+ antiporter-2
MVWIGYILGQMFGWTTLESVYAGAIIAISSTTIIAKAFEEQRVKGKFTDIVLGVLIIEDLIGIFLIAILTTVSAGNRRLGIEPRDHRCAPGDVPRRLDWYRTASNSRIVRSVVRMNRPETTLVASIGICFAAALLALSFGYSVAPGCVHRRFAGG